MPLLIRILVELVVVILLLVGCAGLIRTVRFARERYNHITRRAIIGGIVVVMIALIAGIPIWHYEETQFNAKAWRAARGEGGQVQRCRMVDDLIQHHLATGLRDTDIRALLGSPDYLAEHSVGVMSTATV